MDKEAEIKEIKETKETIEEEEKDLKPNRIYFILEDNKKIR